MLPLKPIPPSVADEVSPVARKAREAAHRLLSEKYPPGHPDEKRVQEYFEEAEHQDGYEYWYGFWDTDNWQQELLRDIRIYIQETEE